MCELTRQPFDPPPLRWWAAIPRWVLIERPASWSAWGCLLGYCLLITIAQLLFIGEWGDGARPYGLWAKGRPFSACRSPSGRPISRRNPIGSVKHLRASTAGILSSAELIFASLLGVVMLRQPTNSLAVIGNMIVFSGSGAVAIAAANEGARPAAAPQKARDAVHGAARAPALDCQVTSSNQHLDEFDSPAAIVSAREARRCAAHNTQWLKGRSGCEQSV